MTVPKAGSQRSVIHAPHPDLEPPASRTVTTWITPNLFRIRTYERGSNSMKTLNFKSRICHTYAARACNPCISNTYEKHRGRGVIMVNLSDQIDLAHALPSRFGTQPQCINGKMEGIIGR